MPKVKGLNSWPKQVHTSVIVKLAQTFLGAAEHLGSAHGLIVYGLGDAIAVEDMGVGGNQQIGHEIDDVAACEVGSGILVIGFG